MKDGLKMFSDGAAYERMMGRWSRIAGKVFLDWLAAPEGLRWLDVGCGNGAFTQTLIANARPVHVAAIDPSPAQIAHAREHLAGVPAVYSVGDVLALSFDDAAFDATTMALVIGFVADPARAVAEMARVTRPGGLVSAYMWESIDTVPVAPLTRAARALGFDGDYRLPSADASSESALRGLWLGAGLEDVGTRRIEISVTFENFEDFWSSCNALPNPANRFMRDLSGPQSEAVRNWLREFLPTDTTGRISYPAAANAVKGRVKRSAIP